MYSDSKPFRQTNQQFTLVNKYLGDGSGSMLCTELCCLCPAAAHISQDANNAPPNPHLTYPILASSDQIVQHETFFV